MKLTKKKQVKKYDIEGIKLKIKITKMTQQSEIRISTHQDDLDRDYWVPLYYYLVPFH